jgi:hypothetical protein
MEVAICANKPELNCRCAVFTVNMSKPMARVLGVAAFIGSVLPALTAHAQCCPGYSPATACANANLTKSRWCIQDTVPTGQAALPAAFCAYGDKVISTLESTFNIQAPGIFEFELDTKTGGAHTGTACQNFGDGAAYDGFAGNAYHVDGFWGYLLSMHEAINDWTGLASGGWPTDWWADHQSAFPNLMDFHIMNKVGTADNDQNLLTAGVVQKGRFYPGGDTADAKVVALDNVYAAMPNGDGFAGFSHLFAMQSGDGVKWDNLGVPNPDVKRSEYVVAYMSLATGKSVLSLLQGPGANGGGNICNNTADMQGDAPYTCSEAHVDAIATAHCSVAANSKPKTDLSALQSGNYQNVASGPCGATCPTECACDTSNHCVAPWLTAQPATGAGGSGGSGGTTGSGTAPPTGGAPGSSGAAALGGATATGGSAGNSGHSGAGGTSVLAGGGTTAGSSDDSTDSSKGCSCRAAGRAPAGSLAGLVLASALAGLTLTRARTRTRRRSKG